MKPTIIITVIVSLSLLAVITSTTIFNGNAQTTSSSISVLNQTAFAKLHPFPNSVLNPLIIKRENATTTYKDLYQKMISVINDYVRLYNENKTAFRNVTMLTEDIKLMWCVNLLLYNNNNNNNEGALRECDVGVHADYKANNFSTNMKPTALLFLRARGL